MTFMPHFRTGLLALLAALNLAGLPGPAAAQSSPGETDMTTVAGWVENVWIYADDTGISITAKLDTGAKSASINASQLHIVERSDARWVAFSLTSRGQQVEINAPVKRMARIRRAGTRVAERPVIDLKLCIAGHTEVVEFTLADRSGMDHQVLVGRNYLAGRLLIDSARSFIAPDICGDAAER